MRTERRVSIAAGLSGLALLGLSACSQGAESSAPENSAPQGAGGIAIENLVFTPSTFEAGVGEEVTWTNDDSVAHTITSGRQGVQAAPGVNEGKAPRPDGLFDEAMEGEGDTFTFTFDEAGTYEYYCDIHRQMTGTVVVGEV